MGASKVSFTVVFCSVMSGWISCPHSRIFNRNLSSNIKITLHSRLKFDCLIFVLPYHSFNVGFDNRITLKLSKHRIESLFLCPGHTKKNHLIFF